MASEALELLMPVQLALRTFGCPEKAMAESSPIGSRAQSSPMPGSSALMFQKMPGSFWDDTPWIPTRGW